MFIIYRIDLYTCNSNGLTEFIIKSGTDIVVLSNFIFPSSILSNIKRSFKVEIAESHEIFIDDKISRISFDSIQFN